MLHVQRIISRNYIPWFVIQCCSFAVIFESKMRKDCLVIINCSSIIQPTDKQQEGNLNIHRVLSTAKLCVSFLKVKVQCLWSRQWLTTVEELSRLFWIVLQRTNILSNQSNLFSQSLHFIFFESRASLICSCEKEVIKENINSTWYPKETNYSAPIYQALGFVFRAQAT